MEISGLDIQPVYDETTGLRSLTLSENGDTFGIIVGHQSGNKVFRQLGEKFLTTDTVQLVALCMIQFESLYERNKKFLRIIRPKEPSLKDNPNE